MLRQLDGGKYKLTEFKGKVGLTISTGYRFNQGSLIY